MPGTNVADEPLSQWMTQLSCTGEFDSPSLPLKVWTLNCPVRRTVELGYSTEIVTLLGSYSLSEVKNVISFAFTVDLPAPVDPRHQVLKLEIYDHDYYAAISLAGDAPIEFRNAGALACEPKIREDKENAYFGDVYPQEITLACR